MSERVRRTAQVALVAVGLLSGGAAAYRYQVTRGTNPSPAPRGPAVEAIPAAGPVGLRPVLQTLGYPAGQEVRVLFCTPGSPSQACAELGTVRAPGRVRARPIPATLPAPGGGHTVVAPGRYELRAGPPGAAAPPVRGRFEVVPFQLGPRPSPHPLDPRALRLGPPREVARGAPCDPRFSPDDRLVVATTLLDPRSGLTVELPLTAAELAWSPRRDRLAIVTDDRKEIRLAPPDGSGAEVVVREARGLIGSVTWSPEGDRIAYVARSQPGVRGGPGPPTVFVFSLLDGSRRSLGPGEAVVWSPAGDRLAVEVGAGGGRAIELTDLAGKRTRFADGRAPTWSPDGAVLGYVRPIRGDAGQAVVARVDAPAPVLLASQDVCGLAFSPSGTRLALVTRTAEGTTLVLRDVLPRPPRRP